MNIIEAIILGVIQGLTELLPISSSAHLTIIPLIFEFQITAAFDVALHFGTFLAIIIFFFKDWINLIVAGFKQVVKKESSTDGKMFWYLVIATIPSALIGFILDKYAEEILNKPLIIGISLIVMGIILYIVDKYNKSDVNYENMNLKQTFFIGLSQALAFIPGVSRSGITMTTARCFKITREAAAKYSFLLSTPIVFAATIYKFEDFSFDLAFILGVLTSFFVGIFVIKFLLEYLKKSDFKVFAIYRIIFGIFIIAFFSIIK